VKNIQPYIIAGMTITIVVLCFFLYSANSSVEVYKKQIELSKLENSKKTVQKQSEAVISEISEKSTKTVKNGNLLIKKLKYETPKISDTTGVYMLEYIRNYRPE